jgi:membrane protease YdiL (CAAX protease family)
MGEALASGPSAARSRRGWKWVFLGPHGLRAGWSLLLFVAIGLLIEACIGWVVTRYWNLDRNAPWTPGTLILAESVFFAVALLVTRVMGRIEGRSLESYGFPPRRAFGLRFWEGAGWGLASCALVYALMAAAGGFRLHGLAVEGAATLRWGALWAVAMLAVGLYEELYFRGFPLFTLSRGLGFWPAALILSLYFGGIHYLQKPNESWLDFLNVSLIGLFFCFTVRRTGDVWFAIGWHFTFNFLSLGVLGSPNSGNEGGKPLAGHLLSSSFEGPAWLTGGPTGAQASVFTLVMVAVLFALFHWRHRQARYPVLGSAPPPASR